MRTRHASPLAMAFLLTCVSGCQSFDTGLFGVDRGFPKASPYNPVTEVVCLWEPAEGIGLDGLPARGFAGQILFFTPGEPQPVQVDGDVTVYVFDDRGNPEEQGRPFHQFEFPAEVWNTYLRESNLGAAYQLFIPYTRKGGYTANCVLRVRLAPENGLPAYSKMSSLHLPGRPVPIEESPATRTAVRTGDEETGSAALPGSNDLAMQIDTTEITHRQPASLSLQRSTPPPNTRSLDAAIADLLRERESQPAEVDAEADDDDPDAPPEPLTGRYSLSPRGQSGGQ